jgi:SAM-dependent methyltransferase
MLKRLFLRSLARSGPGLRLLDRLGKIDQLAQELERREARLQELSAHLGAELSAHVEAIVQARSDFIESRVDISGQLLESRIDNIYKSLLRQEKISSDTKWTQMELEDIIALDFGNLTIRELRERIQAEHELISRTVVKADRLASTSLKLRVVDDDPGLPSYLAIHIKRFEHSFDLIRRALSGLPSTPRPRILDIGTHASYHPEMFELFGENAHFIGSHNKKYQTYSAEHFSEINLERDALPFPDDYFDIVTSFEVIEHYYQDPMFSLGEMNRVLKSSGYLVLSTPNVTSWLSVLSVLTGHHPYRYGRFTPGDFPHVHEFTPNEVRLLLRSAGFDPHVHTESIYAEFEYMYLAQLVRRLRFEALERGDTIFAIAAKTGPVADRRPGSLYY